MPVQSLGKQLQNAIAYKPESICILRNIGGQTCTYLADDVREASLTGPKGDIDVGVASNTSIYHALAMCGK